MSFRPHQLHPILWHKLDTVLGVGITEMTTTATMIVPIFTGLAMVMGGFLWLLCDVPQIPTILIRLFLIAKSIPIDSDSSACLSTIR